MEVHLGPIVEFRRFGLGLTFLVAVLPCGAMAQEALKPLDRNKARTSYSFALRTGMKPFRFRVELDKTGAITGLAVFRQADSIPFQTLPACQEKGLTMELNEYDAGRELLKHADLNFDGFEDVQLLQYFHPHLGKSIYCIYTWDVRNRVFRYAPEIPAVDPFTHPLNKTITVHEDWFGGIYMDRTYRWNGAKLEPVAESGKLYGSENPNCGFTDFCSRLINGKLVTTAERPSGCDDKYDIPLVCPASRRPATR